jgi:pilus assembly protein CpaF
VIVMQDVFRFVQTGVQDGRAQGHFTATGIRPKFMDKLEAAGIDLSPSIFSPTMQTRRKR